MEIQILAQPFSVCKISEIAHVQLEQAFTFLSRTDEELSLVCETRNAPLATLAREDGWRGFRICGVLDFSMVGVLAAISSLLAESGISIFAISTYNTDYIFTKEPSLARAVELLTQAGYTVAQGNPPNC